MSLSQFSNKAPTDVVQVSFDFTNLFVQSGEAIVTATWNVNVFTGTDGNPNAILSGASSTLGGGAFHLISNGLNGVTYQINCQVTTNVGQVLTMGGLMLVTTGVIGGKIQTRQDFADYCIRQLGGGVINVEVSDDQIDDSIDAAMQYFHEYHFDGIERDYYFYQLQGTKITVADASSFNSGDTLYSMSGATTALIASVDKVNNILTTNKQMGIIKFSVGDTVRGGNPGGPTTTISNIVLGDPDLGYIPAAGNIVGVKKILNITSILGSADYMFNVQYQIMLSEVQNLVSQGVSYFYNVQQYLGYLDFVMKKEKDFRFNRRMNRLYLDIAWSVDVRVGDVVIAEVYRALDEDQFPEVYQDIWLRKYTTALIKKIWGGNLRKYQNMQLPGGVTFNGQQIYDEAAQEIATLENEAIYSTSPLEFMVG